MNMANFLYVFRGGMAWMRARSRCRSGCRVVRLIQQLSKDRPTSRPQEPLEAEGKVDQGAAERW